MWRVWGELRRRPHIDLDYGSLNGQRGRIDDLPNGRRRITIEASLTQTERRAVLAHELVHDERGILFTPTTPKALVDKEEAIVRDETARRLVPADLLEDFVEWRVLHDGCATWRDVADEFDVPRYVAEQAVELLERQRARNRHPAFPRNRSSNV